MNAIKDKFGLADAYLKAKIYVLNSGFDYEVQWQDNIRFDRINEAVFLKEAAWVILSSGMKESVVKAKFPGFSSAFYDFASANVIIKNRKNCLKNSVKHFNNIKKINAIIDIANEINKITFSEFKKRISLYGIDYLLQFPFLGPATSYHLAKNIGLDVAKPDRHLLRIAMVTGYRCPQYLCSEISKLIGERISVVDLIFWRFATLNKNYITHFGG